MSMTLWTVTARCLHPDCGWTDQVRRLDKKEAADAASVLLVAHHDMAHPECDDHDFGVKDYAMFAEIARHDEHAWQQIGRCVYCHDCQERLYQGRIPAGHVNVRVPPARSATPRSTRDMRQRWGMDDRSSRQDYPKDTA